MNGPAQLITAAAPASALSNASSSSTTASRHWMPRSGKPAAASLSAFRPMAIGFRPRRNSSVTTKRPVWPFAPKTATDWVVFAMSVLSMVIALSSLQTCLYPLNIQVCSVSIRLLLWSRNWRCTNDEKHNELPLPQAATRCGTGFSRRRRNSFTGAACAPSASTLWSKSPVWPKPASIAISARRTTSSRPSSSVRTWTFGAPWDRVRERHPDDAWAELDAHFEWIGERVGRENYRGCPQINTAAEFPEADHPARKVAEGHMREMRRRLKTIAERAGGCRARSARRPTGGSDQRRVRQHAAVRTRRGNWIAP